MDWDSAALAPIERDAWIFLCEILLSVFFYYLTAYLRALIETENADARATLPREMAEFLIGCWIDARMNAADDAAKQLN